MGQFKCTKCHSILSIGSTTCSTCGKTIDIFDKHASDILVEKYYERKHQGQNPRDAKVVFIGRDANFAKDISKSAYIFNILIEYLDDGVSFWENSCKPQYWEGSSNSDIIQEVHHPFLLPSYRMLVNKDGYTYHRNFSQLQLDSRYAKYISFVEIIDVPTMGFYKNDPHDRLSLFINNSTEHIATLEKNLRSGEKKVVFISDMAISAIGRLEQFSDFYRRIYNKRNESSEGIPVLDNIDNVTIHKCYHFSASHAQRKEHLYKLRSLIDKYCAI